MTNNILGKLLALYMPLILSCLLGRMVAFSQPHSSADTVKAYTVKRNGAIAGVPDTNSGIPPGINVYSKADTAILMLSEPQIDKIIESTKEKDILSPGKIALIGALIGALAAIVSQVIFFWLTQRNENHKLKLELVTEERRLMVLLTEFYNELAWLKVTEEFWYRAHLISGDKEYSNKFLSYRDKIPECKRQISDTTSEYTKTVTKFSFLVHKENSLPPKLLVIAKLPSLREESSDFASIVNMNELETAAKNELVRLRDEYAKLGHKLNEIHDEMKVLIS